MAKLTIAFGILLVLLGIFGFVATGSAHPTALIPAGIGLLFVLFGIMANTENSKKRMLWMHISVTVALLTFLGMIPAAIDTIRLSRGVEFPAPCRSRGKGSPRPLQPHLRPLLCPLLHQCPPQPSRISSQPDQTLHRLTHRNHQNANISSRITWCRSLRIPR